MRNYKLLLFFCLMMVVSGVWGQTDTVIVRDNIPKLNRIASHYTTLEFIFLIGPIVLVVLNYFGMQFFIKTKANDWIEQEIAKKAGLNIDILKDVLAEYARVAELKKKKILVLSAVDGQQGSVKNILDKVGFSNVEWENIANTPTIVLNNVHILLLNDQPEDAISQEQIETTIDKFGKDVAFMYFGPQNSLPVGDYRKKNPRLIIGLCNIPDRLETGILSLLKLV
jgi:hypothetical protein